MKTEIMVVLQAKMTEEQLKVLIQEIINVGEIIGIKLEIKNTKL